MKQIKTIADYKIKTFDEAVNAAIAEGWELIKRERLIVGQDRGLVLLAELEKETITEDEKTCENCKHYTKSAEAEPCASCDPENGVCHWEAEA